jgi:hypothetical protein
VAELTAYRTSALRNELAQHPATALIALVQSWSLDRPIRHRTAVRKYQVCQLFALLARDQRCLHSQCAPIRPWTQYTKQQCSRKWGGVDIDVPYHFYSANLSQALHLGLEGKKAKKVWRKKTARICR